MPREDRKGGAAAAGDTTPTDLARRAPETPIEPDEFVGWTDAQIRTEAEKLGVEVDSATNRSDLSLLLLAQRQRISALSESVLTEVLVWSGSSVPTARSDEGLRARKERLARSVSQVRTMRFAGLSHEGLKALAICRGVPVRGDEPPEVLVSYLKAREGLLAKLGRKRRSLIGFFAEKLVGVTHEDSGTNPVAPAAEKRRLKHEIEDQGLLGGIANRIRRSADSYVQEKLDEIEARIDRKLDEIDARLSDWRDREIANRIRIIKITLWASVVISALSLVYLYVKTHFL